MALIWDKALFDEMYSGYGWKWGVRGSPRKPMFAYNWFAQKDRLEAQANRLLAQPGFAQVSHLAIIGGGFGWLSEYLTAQGITVVNIETSPYVTADKDNSEEADLRAQLTAQGFDPDNLPDLMDPNDPNAVHPDPWSLWLRPTRSVSTILEEDLANNGSRNRVKNALSNNMDGIFTEYVLDSMEFDSEVLDVCDKAEQLRPNPSVPVIHLVGDDTFGHPQMLHKPLTEWRTLLDANGFSQHFLTDQNGNVL